MAKRLTVQELAVKREQAALVGAVESSVEAAKIADRERSGCLVRPNGKIVRKRKFAGVYCSAVKSLMHSTSVKVGSQVPGRALEIVVRDGLIAICPAALVKHADPSVLSPAQRLRRDAMLNKRKIANEWRNADWRKLRAMVAVSEAE